MKITKSVLKQLIKEELEELTEEESHFGYMGPIGPRDPASFPQNLKKDVLRGVEVIEAFDAVKEKLQGYREGRSSSVESYNLQLKWMRRYAQDVLAYVDQHMYK